MVTPQYRGLKISDLLYKSMENAKNQKFEFFL